MNQSKEEILNNITMDVGSDYATRFPVSVEKTHKKHGYDKSNHIQGLWDVNNLSGFVSVNSTSVIATNGNIMKIKRPNLTGGGGIGYDISSLSANIEYTLLFKYSTQGNKSFAIDVRNGANAWEGTVLKSKSFAGSEMKTETGALKFTPDGSDTLWLWLFRDFGTVDDFIWIKDIVVLSGDHTQGLEGSSKQDSWLLSASKMLRKTFIYGNSDYFPSEVNDTHTYEEIFYSGRKNNYEAISGNTGFLGSTYDTDASNRIIIPLKDIPLSTNNSPVWQDLMDNRQGYVYVTDINKRWVKFNGLVNNDPKDNIYSYSYHANYSSLYLNTNNSFEALGYISVDEMKEKCSIKISYITPGSPFMRINNPRSQVMDLMDDYVFINSEDELNNQLVGRLLTGMPEIDDAGNEIRSLSILNRSLYKTNGGFRDLANIKHTPMIYPEIDALDTSLHTSSNSGTKILNTMRSTGYNFRRGIIYNHYKRNKDYDSISEAKGTIDATLAMTNDYEKGALYKVINFAPNGGNDIYVYYLGLSTGTAIFNDVYTILEGELFSITSQAYSNAWKIFKPGASFSLNETLIVPKDNQSIYLDGFGYDIAVGYAESYTNYSTKNEYKF